MLTKDQATEAKGPPHFLFRFLPFIDQTISSFQTNIAFIT